MVPLVVSLGQKMTEIVQKDLQATRLLSTSTVSRFLKIVKRNVIIGGMMMIKKTVDIHLIRTNRFQ